MDDALSPEALVREVEGRVWGDRDVGLIYRRYTHGCVVERPLGATHDREALVRDAIAAMATLPERRDASAPVIWRGSGGEGSFASLRVMGAGRHTEPGPWGPPTGRAFATMMIADRMIHEGRVHREWAVADTLGVVEQLGLDPWAVADRLARGAQGAAPVDGGETGRLLGQRPPAAGPDLSLARTEEEAGVLGWLHDVWNGRMFGRLRDAYAPTCRLRAPLGADLWGVEAVTRHALGLVASIPDAAFAVRHIVSMPDGEGGSWVALRWAVEGHHGGWGLLRRLGEPTGRWVELWGMSHLRLRGGRVVEEWRVYDELALLVQVRRAQLAEVVAG